MSSNEQNSKGGEPQGSSSSDGKGNGQTPNNPTSVPSVNSAGDGKKTDGQPGPVKQVVVRTTPPVIHRPYDSDQPLRPHMPRPEAELLHGSPRVLITPDAYKAMCLYVEIGPLEVGWQGTVSRTTKGDFIIEKTYLLDQDVTGVETELSADARFKLAFELSEKGDEGIDEANRMRFWGHSHVRMGIGPSGTDERTMDQFEREGCPWYVRGIFNKLGRGSFSIFLYEIGFRINDAPWAVFDPATGKILLDRPNFAPQYGGGWGGWRSSQEKQGAPTAVENSTGQQQQVVGTPGGVNHPATLGRSTPSWLPAELVPSAELRAAIAAEYKAKVRERRGFTGWARSFQANNNPGAEKGNGTVPEAGSGDASTNAAIAQMEAQYGTGAMLGSNEPAGDGAPAADGKGVVEQRRGSHQAGGVPVADNTVATGRPDLTGSWIPTDTSSPARPLLINQTGHYVRIELVGRGGERPESLTGAFLESTFMVDGWVSTTSPDVGNMEIKVEVINPNVIRLEGSDKFYVGSYRRGPAPESTGIGDFVREIFGRLFGPKTSE